MELILSLKSHTQVWEKYVVLLDAEMASLITMVGLVLPYFSPTFPGLYCLGLVWPRNAKNSLSTFQSKGTTNIVNLDYLQSSAFVSRSKKNQKDDNSISHDRVKLDLEPDDL